jgi:hypothetical protein
VQSTANGEHGKLRVCRVSECLDFISHQG